MKTPFRFLVSLLFLATMLLSQSAKSQFDSVAVYNWGIKLRLALLSEADLRSWCYDSYPDEVEFGTLKGVANLKFYYWNDAYIWFQMYDADGQELDCLKYRYRKVKDEYYLELGPAKTVFKNGVKTQVVNPWTVRFDECPDESVHDLLFTGEVINEDNEKLQDATMEIICTDGPRTINWKIKASEFSMYLPLGSEYEVIFKHAGYQSKMVKVNTHATFLDDYEITGLLVKLLKESGKSEKEQILIFSGRIYFNEADTVFNAAAP